MFYIYYIYILPSFVPRALLVPPFCHQMSRDLSCVPDHLAPLPPSYTLVYHFLSLPPQYKHTCQVPVAYFQIVCCALDPGRSRHPFWSWPEFLDSVHSLFLFGPFAVFAFFWSLSVWTVPHVLPCWLFPGVGAFWLKCAISAFASLCAVLCLCCVCNHGCL